MYGTKKEPACNVWRRGSLVVELELTKLIVQAGEAIVLDCTASHPG